MNEMLACFFASSSSMKGQQRWKKHAVPGATLTCLPGAKPLPPSTFALSSQASRSHHTMDGGEKTLNQNARTMCPVCPPVCRDSHNQLTN